MCNATVPCPLHRPWRRSQRVAEDYRKEQLDYFSNTAAWTDIHPSQVVGSAACFKSYDLHTVTLEELKAPLKVRAPCGGVGAPGAPAGSHAVEFGLRVSIILGQRCAAAAPLALQASFTLRVLEDGPVDAFCGWFDTQFKGSQENPVTTEVTLTTAPDPTGATHWGQQVWPAAANQPSADKTSHCEVMAPRLLRTKYVMPPPARCCSLSSCTHPWSALRTTCWRVRLRWCVAKTTSG